MVKTPEGSTSSPASPTLCSVSNEVNKLSGDKPTEMIVYFLFLKAQLLFNETLSSSAPDHSDARRLVSSAELVCP